MSDARAADCEQICDQQEYGEDDMVQRAPSQNKHYERAAGTHQESFQPRVSRAALPADEPRTEIQNCKSDNTNAQVSAHMKITITKDEQNKGRQPGKDIGND